MPHNHSSSETTRAFEWKKLYAYLAAILSAHGRGDPFGDGDFFLIDDDYGTYQHKVECTSAAFYRSAPLSETQELLSKFTGTWQVIFVLAQEFGGPKVCTVTRAGIVEHDDINQDDA